MATLAPPFAQISASPESLAAIRDPGCSLAIWERAPIEGLAAIVSTALGTIRFTAALAQLPALLSEHMLAGGYPAGPACAALAHDVADLARRFAAIMEAPALDLRLDLVTTNSCRKFHADYVTARLITTYAGTGTQWLDEGDAARVAAGEEPRRIGQLRAGDVGLFKGRLLSESPIIHRSPPIEGTGEARLLLVLNPADKAQDQPPHCARLVIERTGTI